MEVSISSREVLLLGREVEILETASHMYGIFLEIMENIRLELREASAS